MTLIWIGAWHGMGHGRLRDTGIVFMLFLAAESNHKETQTRL